MRNLIVVISIIILLLLTVSSYSNTVYSPPILDDYHSFIDQQSDRSPQLSFQSVISLSKGVFGWARWIPLVSFAVDRWSGNGSIVTFHVTNILIHAVCLLAVFSLVCNILKASEGRDPSTEGISDSLIAVFVTGLWALHPVQSNAVTYLVQRMASIQAFFFVTSVAFYVLGRRRHLAVGALRQAYLFYAVCSISAAGAFLSKENSSMLPVMILVTEIWFFSPDLLRLIWKRLRQSPRLVRGIMLVLLIGLVLLSVKIGRDLAAAYAGRHFTMWERLLTEIRAVVWYMGLLVWPLPSRMSIEHDVVVSTSLINPVTTLPALASLVLLGWLTLRYRKEYPLCTYGMAWFFLNLLIESSIVPLELIFEHRLYLPSVGFSLSFTCLLVSASRRILSGKPSREFEIITCCIVALLVSGLSLLTFWRNEAWANNVTIHRDAVLKAPNHPRARANAAVALAKAELYELAIKEAEVAISLGQEHHEQYVVAANTIVGSLNGLGRHAEAAERGEKLLVDAPRRPNTIAMPALQLNVAKANLKLGRLEKAFDSAMTSLMFSQRLGRNEMDFVLIEEMLLQILRESARRNVDLDMDGTPDPGIIPAKTWIAKTFLGCGERGEARRLLQLALGEVPGDPETVRLLEQMRREDDLNAAQAAREEVKTHYFSSPFSRFDAAMAMAHLLRRDNIPLSLQSLGERFVDYALTIKPAAADAHLLKAWYLRDRNDIESAIASAQKALAADPDYARAWMGLGFFYIESNRAEEAVHALTRALELYPGSPQHKTVTEMIAVMRGSISVSRDQKDER